MKANYLLFLVFFINASAQFTDKITLSDFEINTKDVVAVKESSSYFLNNDFGKVGTRFYTFDSIGYVTKTPYYSNMVYNKNYTIVNYTYVVDGSKKQQYLTKTPFGTFLSSTNEVTKNKNGSLKTILRKDEKEAKYDAKFTFSYDSKYTTVTPNLTFLATEKFTSDGLKVIEDRNITGMYAFAYDPKSKLEVLQVFTDYYSKIQLYTINFYEYDTYGNWVTKYSYEAAPDYGNSKNKIYKIETRQLTYKSGTITGNDGVSAMKKLVVISNFNALNVKKYDAANLPLFIEAKDLKKEVKEVNQNSQQNVSKNNTTFENPNQPNQLNQPIAANANSNCVGNCSDGWGKIYL